MSGGKPTKQEPSPYEYALADMANQKYAFEKRYISPLEKVMVRRTQQERSPERLALAEGQGISGALAQVNPQLEQASREVLASPMSPAGGSSIARQGALATTRAMTAGGANANAIMGQENRYMGGLQGISQLGVRKSALAQQGMSDAARALAGQMSAQQGMNVAENQQTNQMIGTGVGIAASAASAAAAIA